MDNSDIFWLLSMSVILASIILVFFALTAPNENPEYIHVYAVFENCSEFDKIELSGFTSSEFELLYNGAISGMNCTKQSIAYKTEYSNKNG